MLVQLLEPGSSLQDDGLVKAIGIDLGTTHTVVAFSKNQTPTIINIDESALMPSCVAVNESGEYLVGFLAKKSVEAAHSFKRYMNTPGKAVYYEKNPVHLSAQVLKKIKQEVQQNLGYMVDRAVITVPAYFDDTARQATKDAAMLAGFKVLRLINEPTAAALAYGLDQKIEGTYLVYDFGGGTFDVSILKLTKGVFQVLATSGDLSLGGDDIDHAIADLWVGSGTLVDFKALQGYAREAKEFLASNKKWENTEVCLSLTTDQLDQIVAPYLQKTLKICDHVLKDADTDKQSIDGIVLVGGSTRLLAIREGVEKHFNQKPLTNVDPDQIVALGAALQAEALTKGSDNLLLDVTPLSLGIETMGGLFEKIIPRNSPIPVAIAQDFTTYQDGQTAMKIHVFQGEREFVKDCRSLAQFELIGIPPMKAGAPRIRIIFTIDADGLLAVSAQEQTSGIYQSVHVQPSYGLSAQDLQSMVQESMLHGQDDVESRLLQETKLEAEQIIYFVEHALLQDGDLLQIEAKNSLIKAVEALKSTLMFNDRYDISVQVKLLSELSQPFAEQRIERAIRQKIMGAHVSSKIAE